MNFSDQALKSRMLNNCCFAAPRKGSRWPEALHLLQTFATSKGSVDVVMYNAAPRPSDVGWLAGIEPCQEVTSEVTIEQTM